MTIPTILKGDDAGAITLSLDSSHTYLNAVLVVAYQGVTKTFAGLSAGGTVSLVYTHDETAAFALGCYPVEARLIGAGGAVETVSNAEWRVKVTDIVAEVNCGGSFAVRPGAASVPVTEIEGMGERYKLADLASKVDEICRILAQRTALALAAAAMFASALYADAANPMTVNAARLDSLYNDAQVVTNVTFDATAIPEPDFSPSNATLVATIEATSPAPGDYATVSNKAMTALQSYTETDPTVPGWAKSETQPLPPDYSNVSNKAMTALQSFTETDPTIPGWAKSETQPLPPDYSNVSNKAMTALQEHQDISGKLDKFGDTMTGNLTMTGSAGVNFGDEYLRILRTGDHIEVHDFHAEIGSSLIPDGSGFATLNNLATAIPQGVSAVVTQTYVRQKLGAWIEYDEETGLYYYCHEEE